MTARWKDGTILPSSHPSDLPPTGRLLGVDWGEKRIGLAISDPGQTMAQPLATLTRRSGKRFPMQELRRHIAGLRPVGVVMGLPLGPNGLEHGAAAAARATGALIAQKTGLPVCYHDERLSTARARRAVEDLGGSVRGREGDLDQLAATVLLQTFLDAQR